MDHQDAYKSLGEALAHGGMPHDTVVRIRWIEAETMEESGASSLEDVHGILVPGGFGRRGTSGMEAAAGRARRTGTPFLGICYGMQLAVLEFARTECGVAGATTEELDPDSDEILFARLRVLEGVTEMGGTMRVGAQTVRLKPDSLAARIYGRETIRERHRHRYEFVPRFESLLGEHGMHFTGATEDGYFEVAEIPGHPWFVGVQFHPEFLSNPLRPHPLFRDFVGASRKRRKAGG